MHEGCESRIDLAAGAGVEDLYLQPDGASSWFQIAHHLGSGTGRVDERGHTSGCGHQLTQEFQSLCSQLTRKKIYPCQVSVRPGPLPRPR